MQPDHLSEDIYIRVSALSEDGNAMFDSVNYKGAIVTWRSALAILPEPKSSYEAAMWLYASIGDALYQTGQLEEAREAFFDCLNCPGSQENAFVHLRLGQCSIALGMEEAGLQQLVQAYMLAGTEIFTAESSGAGLLALLRSKLII